MVLKLLYLNSKHGHKKFKKLIKCIQRNITRTKYTTSAGYIKIDKKKKKKK